VNERDPALDHSGRLDRFLTGTIQELKPKTMPNKFAELADKVTKSQKALDARADQLSARLDKLNQTADVAFTKHESAVDQAEHGIDAMEQALSGLIGHNGPNESSN
jgi:vancomycin resistance protein YoaR